MTNRRRYYGPGSLIRTNLPIVSENYQMTVVDRGVVVATAGITITLPPLPTNNVSLGESYFVVNVSNGVVNIQTHNGEKIKISGARTGTDTINANSSRSYLRETTALDWVASGQAQTIDTNEIASIVEAWLAAHVDPESGPTVKGDTGATGAQGESGKSAYQLAVENGYSGTVYEWIQSLRGPTGPTGSAGAVGQSGIQGERGERGFSGEIGEAGPRGESGDRGQRGESGPSGQRGSKFLGKYTSQAALPSIDGTSVMAGDFAYIIDTGELWRAD